MECEVYILGLYLFEKMLEVEYKLQKYINNKSIYKSIKDQKGWCVL